MRIGSALLSLLLVAGCGQASSVALPAGSSPSHDPLRARRDISEQTAGKETIRRQLARRFEAAVVGGRLTAAQHGWPGPRLPIAPPARQIDCTRLKCVALTFDDGPGDNTGKLLDILAAHHARATFFMLGQMINDETRDFVRRMVSEGHEVGNHSWDHASLAGLSNDALKRELQRTQEVVQQVTGVRMTVMRPPYGSTNQQVEAATREEGLAQIMWAVDTLDWRDRNSAIVAKRCAEAKAGDIVLMHDIHPTTVDAVPHLLDELDRKGFTYVTVSELFGSLTPGKQYFNR
ncbi:polysaccharide deacetylase family protein [Planotetraspora sp. A-T 1434]|uniref:polysaccharide deacetylase family protein n=1 Tax=Planotetraspora sp. A-T 1434 TaxID=2979219 RepID=UPI0021BE6A05|nr:polysaccharide deacetylase family protein [Planotetraspora sp. A-T 1434]MCT9933535.1 polysaccharide deacetylase family protein [Planotetraspora sp. A-T 1434]